MINFDLAFEKLLVGIPYKVIHILNFVVEFNNKNKKDYFFRVLFSDLENENYFKIIDLPPYMLNLFTLGNVVKRLGKENAGSEIIETGRNITVSLDVESYEKQNVKKLGDVLTNKEYPLDLGFSTKDKRVYFGDEIKEQYCVIIEKNNVQYVFHTAVIGATFFFISPKFTENLFDLSLEEEYHKVDKNNKSIHLKGGFNNVDAPFLYLYATNPIAKKVYQSVGKRIITEFHKNKESSKRSIKFPLKETIFPFSAKDLEFTLRGEFVSDNKFLVYSIESLDFSKIIETSELNVLRTQREKDEKSKLYFLKKKGANSTGNVNDNLKADYGDFFEKLEIFHNNLLGDNFTINKGEIPYPHKVVSATGVFVPDKSEEVKDLTFKRYGEDFEDTGKGINVELKDNDLKETNDYGFSLDDFIENFKKVCYKAGINVNKILIDRKKIDPSKIVNPKIPLVYSKSNKPREYLVLKFTYDGRKITILEIDHRDLLHSKLYTLVFSSSSELSDKQISTAVHYYLGKSKSLGEIERHFEKQGITLYKKRHPKDFDKKGIEDWIETFVGVLKYKV